MKRPLLFFALGAMALVCAAWSQDGYKFKLMMCKETELTLHGSGVLVAGKATVAMPDWFSIKCTLAGGSITVTPTGSWSPLYVTPVDETQFLVQTTDAGSKSQTFGWEVKAPLKDPYK